MKPQALKTETLKTVTVTPKHKKIVFPKKTNSMVLPRFGTKVNFIKKNIQPVQHPKTVMDDDGFLKPTKYFQTPKTTASTPIEKPRTHHKKIQKVKVQPKPKTYNSLQYLELKTRRESKK